METSSGSVKSFSFDDAGVRRKLFYSVVSIIYLFFFYLMLKITARYVPYNPDVAFLRIKQDVINVPFYKIAFFTHVYTAMFVLLAGFTQFSGYTRKNYPIIHKSSGWLYTIIVLLFAGPSGFYMGLYANGGLISQTAFCLLASLWIYFTGMAIVKAKQRDFKSHRRYFVLSFSLTLSAITLRVWKYVLVYLFEPRPMDVYHIVAWLGWIPNLIIAEFLINKYYNK